MTNTPAKCLLATRILINRSGQLNINNVFSVSIYSDAHDADKHHHTSTIAPMFAAAALVMKWITVLAISITLLG